MKRKWKLSGKGCRKRTLRKGRRRKIKKKKKWGLRGALVVEKEREEARERKKCREKNYEKERDVKGVLRLNRGIKWV